MIRWAVGCVVLGLLIAPAFAARPPEWVAPHLPNPPPKAVKGAVMLHDFEEVRYIGEDRVRRTVRGAIRVTAMQGRARALCAYEFNPNLEKIVSAQAWVIDASGKKAETFSIGQFSDTPSRIGRHEWRDQRRVAFDAERQVEVGGVLAWEYQVESLVGLWDVSWTFDASLPVLDSAFEVIPLPGARLEWRGSSSRVPQPVPGKAPGSLRWTLNGVLPDEADKPDGFQPAWAQVSVRATGTQGRTAPSTWAEFARFAAAIMEQQQVMTDEVRACAESLVAGKTGRWAQVRAIGEFLQRDVAYLSVSLGKDYLAGYRPHPPGEVLKNRFGDCKDKVTLMLAILQAVGVKGYPVLVSSGEPTAVDEKWPGAVFNHVIVGIPVDDRVPPHWPVGEAPGIGKLVFFDPTDRSTPLGFLSAGDQGGFGLAAHASSEGLVAMPTATPEINRHTSTMTAVLEATGELQVKVEERVHGARGIDRQARRELRSTEQAKAALEARLRDSGLIAHRVQTTEVWSDETGEHRTNFEFTAQRYAREVAGMIMIASEVMPLRGRLSPWRTEREGVTWFRAGSWDKSVTLKLPPGMTLVELPDNFSADNTQSSARITYKLEGDTVMVRFILKHRGGLLGREDYELLRTMLANFAEAERQPILLRGGMAIAPAKKS